MRREQQFDPAEHECMVRRLHEEHQTKLGKLALFEELMTYVDDGICTFDQAVEQYKRDVNEAA